MGKRNLPDIYSLARAWVCTISGKSDCPCYNYQIPLRYIGLQTNWLRIFKPTIEKLNNFARLERLLPNINDIYKSKYEIYETVRKGVL